jgi:PAS domain S-box-containing protein
MKASSANTAASLDEVSDLRRRVTELQRIEARHQNTVQDLRHSEERYRRITAAITDYIYTAHVCDGRTVETVHGAACVSVTGYTADEFAADPLLWIRMVPPEDRPLVTDQAACVLAGKCARAVEHRLVRKDGRVRWVRNTPVPHYDHSGRLVAYDGLIQDVTERKLAEEALRESEERFRAIADYTCDWENWFSPQGGPLWVNPAVERWTGYTADECLAMPGYPLSLVHEEDRAKMATLLREAAAGSSGNDVVFRIRRKDLSIAWMAMSWQPIFNGEGTYLGYRTSSRDFTERKRAQQERERLIREREEALAKVKTLHGLLPICASCKKIRNDAGSWEQIETYIRHHYSAEFSHGMCPACMERLYPDYRPNHREGQGTGGGDAKGLNVATHPAEGDDISSSCRDD